MRPDCLVMCRPGLSDGNQLFAFQTLSSLLAYHFLDRVKLWEKFKTTTLFPCSVGSNLLLMAAGKYLIMACFISWLVKSFPGVPLWGLLMYVYAAFQVTKATAEAYSRLIEGDHGLNVGVKIALVCHFAIIAAVIFLIPLVPFLLYVIGLVLQLWAYWAILYTVANNFQADE